MTPPSPFELFAAFAAQLPLLSREDLENAVADLRESSNWPRVLAHARLQARAIGLHETGLEGAPDVETRALVVEDLLVGTA